MQFFILFALIAFSPSAAAEAPPAKQRLLDRTPFDEITLTEASKGRKIETLPLELPQRPLLVVPRDGKLKVRLLERPTQDFEVAWANVAEVRVFEQILLDEARRLVLAGQFDDAYDYFARLRAEYPKFPGLDDAISDYLQRNAVALYQAKQHDRALAMLLTLYERNPTYAGLPDAVPAVAGEIIQRYLREGNYAAARRVLDLWRTQFQGVAEQAATDWQQRFESAAGRQVAEASRLLGEKKYVPARRAVGRALAIWPKVDSAASILAGIEREFPFITVGVLESAPREPMRRIDDWASLRASRLTQQLLAEENDFGSDGGVYGSPFGQWALDETGRELSLKLNPATTGNAAPGPTADAISRFLLSMAEPGNPNFRPDFASLLGGVSMAPPGTIKLQLKRIHVRPESMLQLPLPRSANVSATAAFSVAEFGPEQVVYARSVARPAAAATNPRSTGPQAVVEQSFSSDEAAVSALMAGEIDVLDRVPPWQVERLRTDQKIHVASYKLPTVHVLVPNMKRPLMAKREFRRALCFGIDRKWIVDRVLLGGASLPGFQVVSGPFPAGVSLNDPIRYGYNNQLAPRPFEPRLAAILATIAWSAVQNPTGKKDKVVDTNIPQFVLAYPSDPVVRVACQSMQAQLMKEGIPIQLREFTSDELAAGKIECDLRYAELVIGEPVTDAWTILGPGGLSGGSSSPYVDAALRDLDAATNWKDVRTRLADLHEIASHELPVIPLWQTANYFAYRDSIRGIEDSPVALYQNIGQWSQSQPANVARADQPAP